MIIPDVVRKCVAYIGYGTKDEEISLQGTGFLVARQIAGTSQGFFYLVTAAHVIQGISSLPEFDGRILFKVNSRSGTTHIVTSYYKDWKFHPEESEVDVAVLPNVAPLFETADIMGIDINSFLTQSIREENDLGLGEEVFITGMFHNHSGRKKNIPIVRAGNIAAMPEEKVKTKFGYIDAYLIDARSIGGISGSPVFLHLGMDRKYPKGQILTGSGERSSTLYLLGLTHGHYNIGVADLQDSIGSETEDKINMGIAIVVPSEKIFEVITQPAILDPENDYENELRKQLSVEDLSK